MQLTSSARVFSARRSMTAPWAFGLVLSAVVGPSAVQAQSCGTPTLAQELDAGTEGPPLWTPKGPPVAGQRFSLKVSNTLPLAVGQLAFSLSHQPVYVPLLGAIVHPGGALSVQSFTVGADGESKPLLASSTVPPELCGVELFAQAAVYDAVDGVFDVTNGLRLQVGDPIDMPFFDDLVPLVEGNLVPYDMNQDGMTDLVARQPYYPDKFDPLQRFAVYLAQTDGTFVESSGYESGTPFADFVVADINGDQFGDIAYWNYLLLGDAGGGLSPVTAFPDLWPVLINKGGLDAGDLDDNGWLDLVATTQIGVMAMLNSGGGAFGTVQGSGIPIQFGPHFVALGHFDADGNLDVAAAGQSVPGLEWIEVAAGHGDATFSAVTSLPTPLPLEALEAADLDGDGLDDLIYAMGELEESELRIQRCLGADVFDAPVVYALPQIYPSYLRAFDVNGDGHTDVVVNGGRSVFLGSGNGDLEPRLDFGVFGSMNALYDRNADGLIDIVTAGAALALPEMGTFYRGTPLGLFAAPRIPLQGLTLDGRRDIAAVDLDLDGLDDLLVPDADDDELAVLRCGEGAVFGLPLRLAVGNEPSRVAIGHLNADGFPDAVVAHAAQGDVAIFLGDGQGSGSIAFHPLGAAGSDVTLADLDGNGALDLIVSHLAVNGGFSVALGNGDGTFQAPMSNALTGTPWAVVAGDFDGDELADVLVLRTSSTSYAVVSFKGNGDGTFGAITVHPTTTPSGFGSVSGRSMTATDFEPDGDLDLVVCAPGTSNGYILHWYGDGAGNFDKTGTDLDGAQYAVCGELSGDGHRDLLVSSQGPPFGEQRGVLFFAGTEDGKIGLTSSTAHIASLPGVLTSGDFDRDGVLDVAIVDDHSNQENVWIVLNRLGD